MMSKKSKFYITNHFVVIIIAEILFQKITNISTMVFDLIEITFKHPIIIKTTDLLNISIILNKTINKTINIKVITVIDNVVIITKIITEMQIFVLLRFILKRETHVPPNN